MRHLHFQKGLGVLFILGAALAFAGMNLFVNLAGELPLMQKVFFRNALTLGVTFFLLLAQKEKFRIHDRGCIPWLLMRSLFGFLGVLLNFYAIDHLASISDASILNKLSPFFAILFSALLLRERPAWWEILFVLVAFGGAMLVVRPGWNMQLLPALSGLASGALAGFAYTCVRILGIRGERGMMTVFFFAAFSTVVCLPFLIFDYTPMTVMQAVYLLLAGVCATAGQFFITAAYYSAPAKEIAVFDYAQVPFAAVLGFLFLSQIPDLVSVVGYVVIIGAAVGNRAVRLRRSKRQTASQDKTAAEQEPPTHSDDVSHDSA